MKFSINGRIHRKNGEEQDTVIEIEAANKGEANFFFRHGVHVNQFPDASVSLDFRTLKAKPHIRSEQ